MLDIDYVRLKTSVALDPVAVYRIEGGRTTHTTDGSLYVTGRIGPLTIYGNSAHTIVSGSIAKHLYGTNLATFDLEDVSPALLEVEDVLGLPPGTLHEARVTRLEFGVNVQLRQPVQDYLKLLVAPARTTRHAFGTTVAFSQKQRELKLYDKIAEIEAKGGTVDRGVWGRHVLRFEVRLLRAVAAQLRRTVTGADLCDDAFYEVLAQRLLSYLDTVEFEDRAVLPCTRTPGELGRALARCGMDASGGLGAILADVRSAQRAGLVTREQASRQRTYLRCLHADERYCAMASRPLRDELVAAIYTATESL